MPNRAAVTGVGQTTYRGSHPDRSTTELVYDAVSEALMQAGLNGSDVDSVVFGSAPEIFEGVHEPDKWTTAALGAPGKSVRRIHTGGATGGSAALAAAWMIAAGLSDCVVAVGLQRVAESEDAQAIFTTIFDPVYESDIQLNVITTIGMMGMRQQQLFGLTDDHMAWVSVKNRANGALNPKSHLRKAVTAEEVFASPMLASPIRLMHACPRSDGAAAVVFVSEKFAKGRPAAWFKAGSSASDLYRIGDRIENIGNGDFAGQPALGWAIDKVYRDAGITDPRGQLDVIEVYAPFSNVEIAAYEEMGLAPRGQGWRLVEEGATSLDGDIPVCPSGGCMTANPIAATGLARFAEASLQVMGSAGDHQVDGVRTALATAVGGISQFFTAAILAADPD